MIKKLFILFKKYENHISSLTLVTGFIIDSLTLRRADLLPENIALISYILIISVCILLVSYSERTGKMENSRPILFFVMQFFFGGLFSAFLVFYSRSTSLLASWPFLVLIVGYMIANETLKKHYARFVVRCAALFFSIFTYLIFLVPIIFKEVSTRMFLISSVISLVVFGIFLYVLRFVNSGQFNTSKKKIITAAAIVFVTMNVLYFSRLIPPIPLVLKEVGVYNFVDRLSTGQYMAVGEKRESLPFLRFPETVNLVDGDPIYVFASIFSPEDLDASVIHVWQHKNEETGKWETLNRISIPISGGRENGYRTYSMKNFVPEGKWRVDVVTENGNVIGRINFYVKYVSSTSDLSTVFF